MVTRKAPWSFLTVKGFPVASARPYGALLMYWALRGSQDTTQQAPPSKGDPISASSSAI
jgi:hypothetical protein